VSRSRWLGLLAVLVLLAGALAGGLRDRAPQEDEALVAARAAAALPPCPAGLTTDLPPGSLPCFDGGPDVVVDRAPGTPLLVNVWATWCAPCVDEVPALVEFAEAARGRVDVVGVVHQDSPESVYAFAKTFGIRYPLVRDDLGGVLSHYGSGPPVTLLVRPDGTVAHVKNGVFRDLAEIEGAVAEHLGVRV